MMEMKCLVKSYKKWFCGLGKVQLHECEKCHTSYFKWDDAFDCEKSHKQEEIIYDPFKDEIHKIKKE